MKNSILVALALLVIATSCNTETASKNNNQGNSNPTTEKVKTPLPNTIEIENIAQNPEGIEFDKTDNTFLLSSLNATPILKVNLNGTYKPFTSGEPFPMSTAGLQVDYKRNRLLATAFNGTELMDDDPKTKGVAHLRIYNLKTGVMEKDINLSSLIPEGNAYFANDVAFDNEGNAYVTDWYSGVVYKVDVDGTPSIFARNETGIKSGFNGIDFHSDGYLLVSLVSVNDKGLYTDYGLLKIPIDNPNAAKVVNFTNEGFTGFDGMVLTSNGNVIGVTNNGTMPGGNTLIEISSQDNWESARVINTKAITASTTVAITPDGKNYVINQDFTNRTPENWKIERIEF